MAKSIAIRDVAIATPTLTSVTPQGTAGTTAYTYKIVAEGPDGLLTAASAGVATATGNATLTGVNKNHLVWTDPVGAQRILIYRTASAGAPASLGLIGSVAAGVQAFDDTGLVGDQSTAPATNSTGCARGSQTYLSGSGFNPGRTVILYVKGAYAGVVPTGPYGSVPSVGNLGQGANWGGISADLSVPNPDTVGNPGAGATTLVAMDGTDNTQASVAITTT